MPRTNQLVEFIHQPPADCQEIFLSDIYDKGKVWDKRKNENLSLSKIHYSPKKTKRLDDCNRTLFFIINHDEKIKLKGVYGCNVRHCPVCEWRRTVLLQKQFFQIIPKIHADNPGGSWLLLTLTIKNCNPNDLRENVQLMSKAFNRLKLLKINGLSGFFRTLEITHGEDGTAHPHYHCLINVDKRYFDGRNYISQARWTELWKNALCVDYTPIVDIRKIRNITDDNIKGALEVLKYSIKSDDLFKSPEWFEIVDQQLRSIRKFSSGGTIKTALANLEDSLKIDTETQEDDLQQELAEFSAFFSDKNRRYLTENYGKEDN